MGRPSNGEMVDPARKPRHFPRLDDPEDLERLRCRRNTLLEARAKRNATLDQDLPSVRQFYRGRHVFVTGGSGFVGRVFIEKLLRHCPDVGNVYVLLRPKRGVDAWDRLQDLLDVPLFDMLRQQQPDALSKVVPVRGDCAELGLGLSAEDRATLEREVSVIVHAAASVRFNDPVKKAVLLNTRGAREVARLGENMKNLVSLVHISTAYCFTDHDPVGEVVYPTLHDWDTVIRAAERPDSDALDFLGSNFLGFQPNTYTFTKALAEKVMEDAARRLPVIIMRPTIVTAIVREPLKGWMDNLNGPAGFWAGTLKGVLRVFTVNNPDTRMDMVPCDMCATAILLCSWTNGTGQRVSMSPAAPEVVNVSVSDVKPTSYNRMRYMLEINIDMRLVAYPGAVRYPACRFISARYPGMRLLAGIIGFFQHTCFGIFIDTILWLFNRKPMLMPIYRKSTQAWDALRAFDREFHFETDNFWRLQATIHSEDLEDLDVDMEKDGDHVAMCKDQLMGVLRYALREKCDDVQGPWRHAIRLWWVEGSWYMLLMLLGVWWCLLK